MNERQCLLQLRHLLKARTWADADGDALGSGAKVFGDNVIVSAGARNRDFLRSMSLPAAVIMPGNGQRDPAGNTDPGLVLTTPRVRLIVAVQGDQVGQAALIGHGVGDEGKSTGQGLLQIQEQLMDAIKELGKDSGIWIQARMVSEPIVVELADSGMVNYRDFELEARLGTDPFYPGISSCTRSSGVGQTVLVWTLPAIRYDFVRVKVRRSAVQVDEATALAAAPATHTDGTEVTVGDQDTGVTDSGLAVGWYGYSIFCLYDERSATPADEDHASDAFSFAVEVT